MRVHAMHRPSSSVGLSTLAALLLAVVAATLGPVPRALGGESPTLCLGLRTTIEGSNEADTITGTAGNDVIHALSGHDTVNGLGGDDVICGGAGNDSLGGGAGRDTVTGEFGDDRVDGGGDDDILEGHGNDDSVEGGPGNDFLDGGERGCCDGKTNTGSDSLSGGDGNDELWSADFGRVSMVGGAGDDVFHGLDGDDTLDSRDGVFGNDSGGAGAGNDRCDVDEKDPITECETLVPVPQNRQLTVTVNGNGRVTGSGIDCPGDCTQSYPAGSNVLLTAAAGAGASFAGWGGACSGTAATCTVSMSQDRAVSAGFGVVNRTLTVSVNGNGRVTGSGIDCPGDCTQAYTSGASVQLTAAPGAGQTFAGWGGDCSGSATTCTVTMSADRSVSATFAPPGTRLLTVSVTGAGRVTGTGIDCPGDCEQAYTVNTSVQLTATASASAALTGWAGSCSGATATCTVVMDSNKAASATFSSLPGNKRLSVAVGGTGKVTGTLIDCPSDCAEDYASGTSVTLTAVFDATRFEVEWSGDCAAAGKSAVCLLAMLVDRSATATFRAVGGPTGGPEPTIGVAVPDPLPPLPEPKVGTVEVDVDGNGSVVSTSADTRALSGGSAAGVQRINCGVSGWSCYGEYQPGETVTLKARPAAGYAFKKWTGACSGSTSTCKVVASEARSVTAVFEATGTGAAVDARLSSPRLRVKWVGSVGAGSLVVKGSTTTSANARIDMRRPGGGSLASLKLALKGGSFRQSLALRRGKLAGGAKLFPGGFTVALTGRAGKLRLPLQLQTISIPAPAEGVVRKTFRSLRQEGRAVTRFPAGTKEVWANFRFETQPAMSKKLTVHWFWPGTKGKLGSVGKSNRPVVSSYLKLATGLPSGLWRAELRAGNRVVSTLGIRIG